MNQNSMDPYERQLYAVFTTYADNSGTLDLSSLTELCAALQMEAGSTGELVALAKRPGERVHFSRFRDGLLKVLGGGGDGARPPATSTADDRSDEESSGRELSPKLVYGSKKYGRRSRPRETTDLPTNDSSTNITRSLGLRRAASTPGDSGGQSQITRTIATELDRCVSVPNDKRAESEHEKKFELENIHLDLDHNRAVDCNEAFAMCRSMRMGNVDADLLRQIFEEGEGVDADGRITVGEFFHRLNKKLINSITSEGGVAVLGRSAPGRSAGGAARWEATGAVEREIVVEMWERAGIAHCRQMLHDLGFSGERVHLSKLSAALDKEIKSMLADVDKSSETNVPSLLLQASLCLHRHELRCIRDTMEQVFAENSKMKTDLMDADRRAQLLAQEVDENHAKMESSLRNKVKQLETKHSEAMRAAEEERAREREVLGAELARLEERLRALEAEEGKLRGRCSALETSNEELERRLATGHELTVELEQVRAQLAREVRTLTAERDELREPGRDRGGEVEKLTALLSDFRLENKSLRDRNDELCAEMENLQEKLTREKRRLSLGRSKPQCSVDISSEQAMSLLEEWGGGGGGGGEALWDARRDGSNAIKRRGDSPSKGQYSLFEDESPRIGKLRRRHTMKEGDEQMRTEWELDSCSDGGSLPLDPAIHCMSHTESHINEVNNENIGISTRGGLDNATLSMIRQALAVVNKQGTSNCECCIILKDILSMIHKQIDHVDVATAEDNNCEGVISVNQPATATATTQTDEQAPSDTDNTVQHIKQEKKKCEEENSKLTNMCRDLENSLEQLRAEYDKCEEYWTNKLEEERDIFNDEQRISDEKFQDLLSKISEYDKQFSQKVGSGLPTIDEKYSLELQFTDLEEEFQLYRQRKSADIEEKVKEIQLLKEQVKHLEQIKINVLAEDPVVNLNSSPDKVYDSKVNIISNVEELEKSVQQADSPIGYLWNQSTIQSPVVTHHTHKIPSTRDYHNPAFTGASGRLDNCEDNARSSSDNERESSSLNPIKKPSVPKRCNSTDLLNNPSVGAEGAGYGTGAGAWCGGGWAGEGAAAGGMIQCSELEGQLRRNAQHSQEGSSAWSAEEGRGAGAEAACAALEQRCRQLQLALRQHQFYLDTVQQTARSENHILRQKLFSAESAIGKLQQRLTSADLLVKELYVENCQLSALKPQLL